MTRAVVGGGWFALVAPVLCGAQAAPDASVPFDYVRNQIVVEVAVAGRTLNFIVDTGASTVIDLSIAEEVGLDVDMDRSFTAMGVGSGSPRAAPTKLEGLSLGSWAAPSLDAVAMELDALGRVLGRPLHGALGSSFFEGRAVRIDYGARRLELFDGPTPADLHHTAPGHAFRLVGGWPILDGVLLDGKPFRLLLDTGASRALNVDPGAARRVGLGELVDASRPSRVFGARGAAEARVTTAGSVAIGPAVVQAPEIGLLSSGGVIAGTLGNGFLEHFVVTIDYPRLTLWLDPGAPGPSP